MTLNSEEILVFSNEFKSGWKNAISADHCIVQLGADSARVSFHDGENECSTWNIVTHQTARDKIVIQAPSRNGQVASQANN
jgi:hypothetical protein